MKGSDNGVVNGKHLLRVAHVSLGLEVGGLEKLLVDFARHVDPNRFELTFVSLTTRGCLAQEIERYGWRVIALDEPAGIRPGMMIRLTNLFRRCRAQVVHTHDDRPLVYAAPAARLAGVRCIIHTRHGLSPQSSERQLALSRWATSCVNAMACVSEDCARLSRQQRMAPGKVRTIRNGVDLAHFQYAGPQPHGPVLTVARFSPEKGLDTLLRAAAIATRNEPALTFDIVGDGPCEPALHALARELHLSGHVRFLGQRRDIANLMKTASIYVLPSRSEGMSLTLLEAMASGLPIVATRLGGNPEVVEDNRTGVLVPPGQADQLASALLALWRDPERSRQMGAAGRRRVESHFDVRGMVAQYVHLYQPKLP